MATADTIHLRVKALGTSQAQSAISGVTKAIAALTSAYLGIKGLSAIKNFFASSITAWREQKEAARGTTEAMQEFATQLQGITTLGDEQTLSMMRLGTMMGVSATKINQVTKAAIGLSRAFGVDYNSAMRMAALAEQGQFRVLSRYMPQLRLLKSEKEKLNEVIRVAVRGWQLEKEAAQENQHTGMMNYFGDLKELIGKELLPVVNAFYEKVKIAFASEDAQAFASAVGKVSSEIAKVVFGLIDVDGWLEKFNKWRFGDQAGAAKRKTQIERRLKQIDAELERINQEMESNDADWVSLVGRKKKLEKEKGALQSEYDKLPQEIKDKLSEVVQESINKIREFRDRFQPWIDTLPAKFDQFVQSLDLLVGGINSVASMIETLQRAVAAVIYRFRYGLTEGDKQKLDEAKNKVAAGVYRLMYGRREEDKQLPDKAQKEVDKQLFDNAQKRAAKVVDWLMHNRIADDKSQSINPLDITHRFDATQRSIENFGEAVEAGLISMQTSLDAITERIDNLEREMQS